MIWNWLLLIKICGAISLISVNWKSCELFDCKTKVSSMTLVMSCMFIKIFSDKSFLQSLLATKWIIQSINEKSVYICNIYLYKTSYPRTEAALCYFWSYTEHQYCSHSCCCVESQGWNTSLVESTKVKTVIIWCKHDCLNSVSQPDMGIFGLTLIKQTETSTW